MVIAVSIGADGSGFVPYDAVFGHDTVVIS